MNRLQFIGMLQGAAAQVRGGHERLSQLDSCGGDGDHGTTMLRAMNALTQVLEGPAAPPIDGLLQAIGWAIMGVDGGATGPLFGTFFLGMAEPAAGREVLDAATLAAMFEAGLAGVEAQTKARPGDKTMLDALVPAVTAARRAAVAGAAPDELLRQAAEAAAQGAEATQKLQAKFGRARTSGAKSIGVQDPGATSVSLIFRGFFEGAIPHA
jgi:dihydroxyacetone kinase-like protein